ncbi:MAG: hypothetical protein ACTTJC_08390 [Campylobacter sp.]
MQNSVENKSINSGWSWMGFLFSVYYYAGYRKLKKAIIMSLLMCLIIPAFIIPFYCGFKAKSELPIKQVPFSWGKVGILVLVAFVIQIVFVAILS